MLSNSKVGDLVFINISNDPFIVIHIDKSDDFPVIIQNINNKENLYELKFNGESNIPFKHLKINYKIDVNFSFHENTDIMYIDKKYFQTGYYLDHLFRTKLYNEYRNGLILFCGNKTVALNNKKHKLYNSLDKKDP